MNQILLTLYAFLITFFLMGVRMEILFAIWILGLTLAIVNVYWQFYIKKWL